MRLGFVSLGLIFLVIITSRFSAFIPASQNANWPWLVVIVATAASGLANLRLCRVPGQIQAELLQTEGDPRRWQEIRPMAGSGPIVNAWNSLLEQAHHKYTQQSEQPAPKRNDDEQTALMARAMRSVSAGIAVTDAHFQILAINGPVAALLGIEDPQRGPDFQRSSNKQRVKGVDLCDTNLLSVLSQIAERSTNNRSLKDDLAKLAGSGNSVTVRLSCGTPFTNDDSSNSDDPQSANGIPTDPNEIRVLRISRTKLSGRDGDQEGFAWLIQDISQQVMASAARDQFLQTATHELRTPLANLRAYAEALSIESGVSVEEQKEFCNIITDETNRLSRLVDHLLTVGQLEAGSLVIQRHSLDPARIIEEAIEYSRPQITAAGLTLQTDISPKLRKIVGDKDKLHAVMVNLIGNAAKYTPSGGNVRIVAKLRQDIIEIAVEDNGIGIGPDDLQKVFEKFYRVQNEHVNKQAGNGLGLAFAREVARLHHGDITVESQLGEGSVFTLKLPAPDEPTAK